MDIGKVKNKEIGVYGKKRSIQKDKTPQRSVSRPRTQKEKAIYKKISGVGHLRCTYARPSRRR